ncbi:putative methyltransferase isoform 2-T2 [Syngnathus typhle]
MAHRLFEGKAHAASYWKYRVSPSDQLIQHVITFVEKQKGGPLLLAVDVGCGSGQGTVLLAKHFASVVGTDVSPAQLEVALQRAREPNVTYRQCVAEELPFADSSVDLITAMSAFHWFDRRRFLHEAHRVLKPHGCLALLNYTLDMELDYPGCCLQSLNQVCKEVRERVGEDAHAALRLHGLCGIFLQLSGSSEGRPPKGREALAGHLPKVDVHHEGDLRRDASGGGCQVFLPAGKQRWPT